LINNLWIAISRTEIIQEVWWWDSLFEWDGKLDVYISSIRKKLGKDLIETVKGFGYKIEK
jgi:DNA-binding response OmpR family regulator